MPLKRYHTGFVVTDQRLLRKTLPEGRGWSIALGASRSYHPPRVSNSQEILILASSRITAQQAADLIKSALVLINGHVDFTEFPERRPFVYVHNEPPPSDIPLQLLDHLMNYSIWTPDVPLACKIAAKVSFDRHYSYALAKFHLSCFLHSMSVFDLDPHHSQNMRLTPFFEDHVRFAYSIMLSYSAIEEIGLEVRASKDNPSRDVAGNWNPGVKSDLERRLCNDGIDLTESFPWNIRGPKTKIEKKRPPRTLRKAAWARFAVRDVEVKLVDAIADSSWLRDRVSAHAFSQLVSSLSVYDVANVQHLARRLILESLGFWRYHQKTSRQVKGGS